MITTVAQAVAAGWSMARERGAWVLRSRGRAVLVAGSQAAALDRLIAIVCDHS